VTRKVSYSPTVRRPGGDGENSVIWAKQNSDFADTSLTLTGRYNPKYPATSNKEITIKQAGSATSRNTLKAPAPYF
jgi:hypothetical protein